MRLNLTHLFLYFDFDFPLLSTRWCRYRGCLLWLPLYLHSFCLRSRCDVLHFLCARITKLLHNFCHGSCTVHVVLHYAITILPILFLLLPLYLCALQMHNLAVQSNFVNQKVRVALLQHAGKAQIVRTHVFGNSSTNFALEIGVNGCRCRRFRRSLWSGCGVVGDD